MLQTYFKNSTLISAVQKVLGDEWGYIWDPETELVPALNGACETIVGVDNTALIFNMAVQIVPFYIEIANGGGTGYAEDDTIVLAGGTSARAITLLVSGVNDTTGAVDQVQVQDYGSYSAYPANPISQGSTSGAGTGATFLLFKVGSKQSVPPTAASLIDVRRNLGTDGETPGPAITKVPRDSIDSDDPTWIDAVCGVAGAPASPVHYTTDENDPKRYYLWPTPNVMQATWWVEMIFRAIPNNVGLDDAFPLPAVYMEIAKCYIVSRVVNKRDNYNKTAEVQAMIDKWDAWFEKQSGATQVATKRALPTDKTNKNLTAAPP